MLRHYSALVREYLNYFPCVVIIGARQTGKSTLIQMLADDREVFDLETKADYDQIANDPDFFLRTKDKPIAIDEAQLLPELFSALRVAIDRRRDTYGQYLLSGSSSPQLLASISESLAGRVGIIEIAPLSFSEIQSIHSPHLLTLFSDSCTVEKLLALSENSSLPEINNITMKLQAYWLRGGYPEPWLRNSDRFSSIWREQYLKTYIERDISRLFPGLNGVRFRRFIDLLASSSGSIINHANIARILDVSQPTVKDYYRIAHGSFIWRNLAPYTKNVSKRVSRHPRGYFRDTGLLHHILQIPSQNRLYAHPIMGASWEGFVIEELLRNLNAFGIHHKSYYYRTSAGAEVDLIIEGDFGLIPIEIKHSQNVNIQKLRAIKDFIQEFDCQFGIVINNDEKVRLYSERLVGIPLALLVQAE